MSLSDLSGGASGPSHSHDDDDDEEDDPDLYAGGEKSGLAVQNPDDLKKKILEKARKRQGRPQPSDDDAAAPRPSHFSGAARTLGGEDAVSQVIEDPNANVPQPMPRVERTLHFWNDGFSVDDGPLYRNDDPANAGYLELIRQGRAPYAILNVAYDQETDVKLEPHDSNFVQAAKKYVPFSGGGQRLGSVVPGENTAPANQATTGSTRISTQPTAGAGAGAPSLDVDDSQPTIPVQIRLGDGTRLVSRFNTSRTIGDLYAFVAASNPASQARPWVLMTTFPSKELSDKAVRLEDLPEFKRSGTVVQKWS